MKPIEKIDLFKQLKTDFKQTKEPILFKATSGQYLTVDGKGLPGGETFQQAIEALYSVAFTVKMTRKADDLGDYVVCKLEALWWVDGQEDFSQVDQDLWQWKLMIRTPDCVEVTDLQKAVTALKGKGKARAVENITLENLDEGLCVQMLHLGPYDRECETIAEMQTFMEMKKVKPNGPYHEIYISDPRRVAPERLKTILRKPVVAL